MLVMRCILCCMLLLSSQKGVRTTDIIIDTETEHIEAILVTYTEHIDALVVHTLQKDSIKMDKIDTISEPISTTIPLLISKLISNKRKTSELVISKPFIITRSSEIVDPIKKTQISANDASSSNAESTATVDFHSSSEPSDKVDLVSNAESISLTKSSVKSDPSNTADPSTTKLQYTDIEQSTNTEQSTTADYLAATSLSSISESYISSESHEIVESNTEQSTTTDSLTDTNLYSTTEAYISTESHEIVASNITGFLSSFFGDFARYDDYDVFEEYDGYEDYGGDGGGYGGYNDRDRHGSYESYEDYEDYGGYGGSNHHHEHDDYETIYHEDGYDDYIETSGPGGFDLFWWYN